ncbi:hypothetical protein DIPPA_17859 [Diplonema papillatum]|nr:hypothetical protein DIPPA_17859 [Diplonema papillatum]
MYEWHHNSATSPASSPGGWRSPAGVLQPEEPSSASQVTKLMLEGILDQLETDRTRRMSLSPSFHASYSLSASSADRLTRRAADAARDHLADRTDVSADHQQHLAATPRRELNASSVSASSERLAALEASVTTLTNLLAPLQKQWRDDRSLNQSRRSDSDALPLLLEEVRSLKDQIRRQQQQQQPAADAGRKAGHPLPPLVNSSAPRRRAQPHDVAAFGAAASLGEPSAAAGAASLSWTTMRTPSPAKRGVRLVEPGFLSAADLSNISRIEFDGLALYRPRLRQCIAANAILRLSDNKVAFLHADDRSLICEAPVAHLVEAELRGPSCFVQVSVLFKR